MKVSNDDDNPANALAELVDKLGGGYPLISVMSTDAILVVLWQYEKQDIVIRCTGDEVAAIPLVLNPEEPLELKAPSVVSAFDLIRQTECLRQQTTDYPYLRFGPMPGTTLDPKFFKHNA